MPIFAGLTSSRSNGISTKLSPRMLHQEQDKTSDIEQQSSFGDRKLSNTLPQRKVGTKQTGASYNLDKVWSGEILNCSPLKKHKLWLLMVLSDIAHFDILLIKKEETWLSSMTNVFYTSRKSKQCKATTQKVTKHFDYTTIADIFRTVSLRNDSHPTGVLNRLTWS